MTSNKSLMSIGFVAMLSMAGCYTSSMQHSEPKPGTYYNQDSQEENEIYFNNVTKHFKEIGKPKDMEEIKQLTAAVFIASLPPVAEVYVDNEYTGKTNVSMLYFKPGTQTLVFKKGDIEWSDKITLTSGRNRSIFAKK